MKSSRTFTCVCGISMCALARCAALKWQAYAEALLPNSMRRMSCVSCCRRLALLLQPALCHGWPVCSACLTSPCSRQPGRCHPMCCRCDSTAGVIASAGAAVVGYHCSARRACSTKCTPQAAVQLLWLKLCPVCSITVCVLQCLRLLGGLTAVCSPPEQLLPGRMWPGVAPNAAAVVQEMQATSMVSQQPWQSSCHCDS